MQILEFSAISAQSLVGRILRRILNIVPDSAIFPILQGSCRGLKWIVGSATKGCWLGSYEKSKQDQIASCLKTGDTFFDIGANVGFYTLLASRRVGVSGTVVAFEPAGTNFSFLTQHVGMNSLKNARLLNYAVSDEDGHAFFESGPNRAMGHISPNGSVRVRTVRLDTAMEQEQLPPPNCIKIDVEGAEVSVLRGAANTLRRYRPLIFLATHSPEVHRESLAVLASFGYHCAPLDNACDLYSVDELVARPGSLP